MEQLTVKELSVRIGVDYKKLRNLFSRGLVPTEYYSVSVFVKRVKNRGRGRPSVYEYDVNKIAYWVSEYLRDMGNKEKKYHGSYTVDEDTRKKLEAAAFSSGYRKISKYVSFLIKQRFE